MNPARMHTDVSRLSAPVFWMNGVRNILVRVWSSRHPMSLVRSSGVAMPGSLKIWSSLPVPSFWRHVSSRPEGPGRVVSGSSNGRGVMTPAGMGTGVGSGVGRCCRPWCSGPLRRSLCWDQGCRERRGCCRCCRGCRGLFRGWHGRGGRSLRARCRLGAGRQQCQASQDDGQDEFPHFEGPPLRVQGVLRLYRRLAADLF